MTMTTNRQTNTDDNRALSSTVTQLRSAKNRTTGCGEIVFIVCGKIFWPTLQNVGLYYHGLSGSNYNAVKLRRPYRAQRITFTSMHVGTMQFRTIPLNDSQWTLASDEQH